MSQPARSAPRGAFRRFLPLLQGLAILLILFFWRRSIRSNWGDIAGYQWQVSPIFLFLSMVVLLGHLFLLASIWHCSLRFLGVRRPWRETTRMWALAQLARYIPGGIWDVAGRMAMGMIAGYPKAALSVSILLEMVLQALSAALIFALTLPFWPRIPQLPGSLLWGFALIPIVIIALQPRLLNFLLVRLARVTGRAFIPLPLRYGEVFLLLCLQSAARLVIGTGFHLFIRSLDPSWGWEMWPVAAGSFAAAWLVGFLIVFVPMGIGVREGIIVILLAPFMPFAPANAVAVGFRLWIALRDALFAGIGALLKASHPSP